MSLRTNLLLIILGAIFIWFIQTTPLHAPEPIEQIQPIATSTDILPLATSTTQATTTITIATSTKAKQPTPLKKPLPITPPVASSTVASTPPPTPEPPPDFERINNVSRQSIVNILCTTKGNELSPITATGIMIDPRGIILTNAHVGQYMLLRNFREKGFVQCVVRTGSPAYPRYTLELMYISPRWVEQNKTLLKDTNPKGTGQYDYAFLHITGSLDKSPLPNTFPYLTLDIRNNIDVEPVILISYPAGFLGGISVLQDLSVASAITTVQKAYTYSDSTSTLDLISVGGTVLSQKGASGGAVIDRHGNVIGMITTTSDGQSTSDRDLRAITISHINRSLSEETTSDIDALFAQNPSVVTQTFQKTIEGTLIKLITDAITK